MHGWQIKMSGRPDAANIAKARMSRDAGIASRGASVIPHDDVLFDLAMAGYSTLLSVVDPSATAVMLDLTVDAGCSDDAHLGPFVSVAVQVQQPNMPANLHGWSASSYGQLQAGDEALLLDRVTKDLEARGRSLDPADSTTTASLVALGRSVLTALAPTATDVECSFSASLGDDSLDWLSATASVIVHPPPPAIGLADPLAGIVSPPVLAASVNDYNPANLAAANVLRLNAAAARNITGLVPVTGRDLRIVNVGTGTLTLVSQSASSAAANRFALAADFIVAADAGVTLTYDPVSLRWRITGKG